MKERLTLTIDPKVSHRAREAARGRGMSLSALVEKLLSEASGVPGENPEPSFSQRWKGRMTLTSDGSARASRLRTKYKLDA